MENKTKNLFETFADAQKQVVENMTNASQHMAKSLVNNDINSDFFKKWYDSQMAFFNQNGKNAESNPVNMFTNWMQSQAKMGTDYMNNMQNTFTQATGKSGFNSDFSSLYNNWLGSMNSTMQQMMQTMNTSGDAKNAMSGMFNNAEMMMKMYQMWMPFAKMINDQSFTPDAFKKMFDQPMYKEMMDKMLNLQPDFVKNMMDMTAVREQMVKMMDMNKSGFDQFRSMFASFTPDASGMFSNMNEQYTSMWNTMNQAAAPMMKMMGNTATSNSMNAASEIMNEFNHFMMKNAEVQYATYQAGNEAMNEFAENVYTKMKNGDDMSNFMTIYSEWLSTNDKHLTALFTTAEYSKLQAELNTFGMKLKQHMNGQMEKAMKNIPVVPRSEMDELYKTVYELRKRINMLEKQLDADTVEVTEPKETKTAAKKTAKNS